MATTPTAGLQANTAAAFAAVRKDLAARLAAAAELLAAEHRRRLGVPNPRPYADASHAGEYPRRRTGRGLAAVHVETVSPRARRRPGRPRRRGAGRRAPGTAGRQLRPQGA